MDVLADRLRFPEGPVALPDGSVLVVEIAAGCLTRVSADGAAEVVAHCGGGPNGAAFGPDGRIWVCNNGGLAWQVRNGRHIPSGQAPDYKGGSIQAVDLESGTVETVYDSCDGMPLRGPNDIVFDGHGGFWFTDSGKVRARDRDHGGLYYGRADGSGVAEVLWGLHGPNGVGLSPDGRTIYVSMTTTGRVYSWPVGEPGVLDLPYPSFRGRLVMSAPGEVMFDSLGIEADGHICVATIRGGGIAVIDPDGAWTTVETGDSLTTNICFGGPSLTTAYITCSGNGQLLRTEWPRPGLRLHHNPYPA